MTYRITTVLALILLLNLTASSIYGGQKNEKLLDWMTYDAALEKATKENKHILVNFTTKWCGYCRKMEAITYRDSGVVATLVQHYSLAVVDGDSYNLIKLRDGDITEKGLTRQFGVRGYPTTWLLEPDGTKIAPVNGYVDSYSMQYVLNYISTDSNEKMSFKEFVEQQKRNSDLGSICGSSDWKYVDMLEIDGQSLGVDDPANKILEILTIDRAIAEPEFEQLDDGQMRVTHHYEIDGCYVDVTFEGVSEEYRVRSMRVRSSE